MKYTFKKPKQWLNESADVMAGKQNSKIMRYVVANAFS